MKRTLHFTRKYFLGNFQTTDIGDSFIDVPEELALNQELVQKLYYLQAVTSELAFARYTELRKKVGALSIEKLAQQITILEQERNETLEQVDIILHNKKEEKEDGN